MRTLISISLGLLLAGCPELPEGRFRCDESADCPGSMQCNPADDLCYSVLPDAGADDGAITDASDGAITDAEAGTDAAPVCELQGEAGSRTFAIARLMIPKAAMPEGPLPTVGFDVDGLNTTSSADVAGCRKVDLPGGIDNAYMQMDDATAEVFAPVNLDFNASFQAGITDQTIDLEVVIADWNLTSSDPCVTVTLQGAVAGVPIAPLSARGSMVAGRVAQVSFGANLRIAAKFALNPDAGTGVCTMNCVTYDLPLNIQDVHARLRLSGDLQNLVVSNTPDNTNSTMIGGYVRYIGEDADAFGPNVTNLVMALEPSLVGIVTSVFASIIDLDTTPILNACTSVSDAGPSTSADSFSIALLASSTPP